VRESFTEYKKTLELNLQNVAILYSGDVISSVDTSYSEKKTSPLTSPSFIINCITDIYRKSFQKMSENSKEIVLSDINSSDNLVDKIISICGKNIKFIFTSESGKKRFSSHTKVDKTKDLPGYLYPIDSFIGLHIDLFVSPLITEDDGELIFYVVDNSIQSLVYSIQNMDYLIEPFEESWKHSLKYNLYDCKYQSWKIVLKNISKMRNDKINQLLNGN
jgi:hypothetical protein